MNNHRFSFCNTPKNPKVLHPPSGIIMDFWFPVLLAAAVLTTPFTCKVAAAQMQTQYTNVSGNNVNKKAGTVKILEGRVWIRNPQGDRLLKAGDLVFPQDTLVADGSGSASVALRDGTVLVVNNNSQLQLRQFTFDSTTQEGGMAVHLLQGSMRMLTGLIAKINPNAVQVTTQTVNVGVRGTDFIVDISEPQGH